MNWADGEQGIKTIAVPVTNTAAPQLPRQFKSHAEQPDRRRGARGLDHGGGADRRPGRDARMLRGARRCSARSRTARPPVSAEGAIGDSTMGGSGVTSGATSEAGRFIYQSRTGDGVLTMQVPTPTPAQSTARFAVMVRASTANNAIMAASTGASSAANFGTKLAYRNTVGGGATVTPSTDNNLDTPQWLRITRAGNTFTAESSADGTTWTMLGSTTLGVDARDGALGHLPLLRRLGFHVDLLRRLPARQLSERQRHRAARASHAAGPRHRHGHHRTPSRSPGRQSVSPPVIASSAAAMTAPSISVADLTSGATTSFNDTTVGADIAYEYRIVAYNSTGDSAWCCDGPHADSAGGYHHRADRGWCGQCGRHTARGQPDDQRRRQRDAAGYRHGNRDRRDRRR